MALSVQQAIAGIDPGIAVANILTMDQIVGQSTIDASFDATLLFVFAVISLLLAAVGLFGVLSYIVAQRTAEIGIRMALGAQRPQVMRLMLRDGVRPRSPRTSARAHRQYWSGATDPVDSLRNAGSRSGALYAG
jgi:hypothetical protein